MSDERKVDHILGAISAEIELTCGQRLTVRPATMGQRKHIAALLEALGGFMGRLGGDKTEDRKKEALGRELQARLGRAEADVMNAEAESAELAEALAKKEMLEARLRALDASPRLSGLAGGWGRLVSCDVVPALMENFDRISGPVLALAGYQGTDEELEALPVADAALMMVTVLVVNVDFFAQRLKPINEALANLKSALLLRKPVATAGAASPTGDS